MKIISAIVVFSAFLLLPCFVYADEDFQFWNHYSASGPLGGKDSPYSLRIDAQQRFQDSVDRMGLLVIGAQLGYRFNSSWSVSGGYMWVPIFGPARNRVRQDEHRLLQQLNYFKILPGNYTFGTRSRIEERFLEAGNDISLRFRELLRFTVPLTQKSVAPYLVTSNELLYNLTSTEPGPQEGFNQNRAFLGLGAQPVKWLRVEAGYLNQYNHRPGTTDRIVHALQLTADYLW